MGRTIHGSGEAKPLDSPKTCFFSIQSWSGRREARQSQSSHCTRRFLPLSMRLRFEEEERNWMPTRASLVDDSRIKSDGIRCSMHSVFFPGKGQETTLTLRGAEASGKSPFGKPLESLDLGLGGRFCKRIQFPSGC
jgi:hypothetical protein